MLATPAISPAQRQAIEAPLGPVLVIAGPGAGKTYCLIKRVEHLLSAHRLAPHQICAVTFTNKAAEEIAVRLRETLGHAGEGVTRGTLHWLCAGILRDHAQAAGLRPGFGIADEAYQKAVLCRLGAWSKRRTKLLTLFGRRRLQHYPLAEGDERLFDRYVAALRERNMVDFDDLISLTAQLFHLHAPVADAVAARWRYVLVDEGQDLDETQYAILKRLAEPHRNIFVVGDDEQSIFSWRGAEPAVLQRFQQEFGIEAPVVLDRNRRCSRQIFDTARLLVAANPSLFDKQLSAERTSAHEVEAYGFADHVAEADWILADLRTDRERAGHSWGEYAVLYRRHETGADLEHRFLAAGIPCRLAHGRAAADDEVIARVAACLRVMMAPDDRSALEALAAQVFPEPLLEQLRADSAGGGDLVAAVRSFARRHARGEPDTRRAWRFIREIENLAALRRAHATLAGVVPELLIHRVGRYGNPLEDRYEELPDPAEREAAVRLATRLRAALAADGRIWLAPAGGVEIALRGMAFAVGYAGVNYLDDGAEPLLEDAIIGPGDAGPSGLTITTFQALQLLQARDYQPGFRDYVAFDLETSDLDSTICDIVELGAVKVRDGQPVEMFHTLIRGSRAISPQATAVHGYVDADVASAPALADVWRRFLTFVGGDVLVAHNAQRFDAPVLRRVGRGLDGIERMVFFDTFPLARSLYRDSARLADLAARFGIDPGCSHHALDDARTLVRVFQELSLRRVRRARIATLSNLLDYVALGLALEPAAQRSREGEILFDAGTVYALGRYSECLEFYEQERARAVGTGLPALDELIDRLGGRKRMERLRAEPDPKRRYPAAMARLDGLIAASEAADLEHSVSRFLERVALSTSEGPEVAPNRVNLLTLHSTKGLEFDCVYIVGVEDGQLPGALPGREIMRHEVEEARRLLYVGMTRARDRLILTRARERGATVPGGNQFLDEMGLEPVYVQAATVTLRQS